MVNWVIDILSIIIIDNSITYNIKSYVYTLYSYYTH